MFIGVLRFLQELFGKPGSKAKEALDFDNKRLDDVSESVKKPIDQVQIEGELVAFDENLLEKSRTQWQFGDWENLAKIDRATLQHHPDRQKLALFAAAGRLQLNMRQEASQLVQLGLDWGANRKLVAQILCSGVHNSLACAAALAGRHEKAELNFKSAIALGAGGADTDLLLKARIQEQTKRLQLSGQDIVKLIGQAGVVDSTSHVIRREAENQSAPDLRDVQEEITKAWVIGRWEALAKIDNADLGYRDNRSVLAAYAALGYQQLDDFDSVDRCTRLALEWGLPRETLKRFLGLGIRNTLGIAEALSDNYESSAQNFTAALKLDDKNPRPGDIKSRVRHQLKSLKGIEHEKVFEEISKHITVKTKGES